MKLKNLFKRLFVLSISFMLTISSANLSVFADEPVPSNQKPTVSEVEVSVEEGGSRDFAATDFSDKFLDIDGGSMTKIKITSLPANGTLKLDGSDVGINDEIEEVNISKVVFTPVPNWNGETSFNWNGNDGTDYAISDAKVTITVNSVNDAPSFKKGADQTVLEDSAAQSITNWATDISKGPEDEVGQTLEFITELSDEDKALFNSLPAISVDGTLTFTPKANVFGTAVVKVTAKDYGGADNAIEAVSSEQSFNIEITPVNDIPFFTKGEDVIVDEDAGSQIITNWAKDISKGNPEELSSQTISFNVTNNNAALFNVEPVLSEDGTLTFTMASNASGNATVTVTLVDDGDTLNGGKNTTDPQTFFIVVDPVNDPATISDIADQVMNEDDPVKKVDFTVNDIDNEESLLTITAESDDKTLFPDSSFIIGGSGNNRSISFVPVADKFGTAKITIKVSDGYVETTKDFNVTVTSVNDLPEISSIADQTINEDNSTGNILFTVNDVETDANSLTVTYESSDITLFPDGSVTIGGTGTKRYINLTPAANIYGTSKITVTIRDGNNQTSKREFNVTVNSVNDAPNLNLPGSQTINEDYPTGDLVITISDVETTDADVLILTAVSQNENIIDSDGIQLLGTGINRTIKLTPVPNASGTVAIKVSLSDESGVITTKTLIVNVLPVNDAPTIDSITDKIINEDEESVEFSFNIGDVDNNPEALGITVSSSNTSLLDSEGIILGGSGTNRTIKFKPKINKYGQADITLTLSDGSKITTITFKVTVNNVNDVPRIIRVADQVIGINSSTAELLVRVWDIDTGDTLTITATAINNSGLISSIEVDDANKTVKVNSGNTPGEATIRVTVTDSGSPQYSRYRDFVVEIQGDSGEESVISYIRNQVTDEDTETGYIYFNVNSDYSNVTVTSGNTTVIPNSRITFEKIGELVSTRQQYKVKLNPALNENGATNVITVTAKKEDGTTATRDFNLNVLPVNDLPIINGEHFTTVDEDNPVPSNFITITDADLGDVLNVSVSSSDSVLFPEANISVTGTSTEKTIVLTPAENINGSTVISVWATDSSGVPIYKNFHITVSSVNDIPTITDIGNQSMDEDTLSGTITFEVDDVEIEAGNLTVSATSSDENLIANSGISFGGSGKDRTLILTPEANKYTELGAKVTITVKVSDGVDEVTKTFDVTMNPVNDAPTISFVANQIIDEDAFIGPISFNIGDIDSDVSLLTVEATSRESDQGVIPNNNIILGGSANNRTLTLTPLTNMYGDAVITIKVADDKGAFSTRTFKFKVSPVNDAPTLTVPSEVIFDEDNTSNEVAITMDDLETSKADLTYEVISGNETILPKANITQTWDKENGKVTFTFQPALNQNGSVNITFKVTDKDAIKPITVTKYCKLIINPTNDNPTITDVQDQDMNEDGTAVIPFTVGDVEKSAGSLVITATSSNPDLVPSSKIILGGLGAVRTIKLIPVHDKYGDTTITLTVDDEDGGTATDTFILHVLPANDPPTFELSTATQTVLEDSGLNSIDNFVKNKTTGIPVEDNNDQTLYPITVITVVKDAVDLFEVQPNIDGNGKLTYTLKENMFGEATVTVSLKDKGGTANGGIDTTTKTFKIIVTPVNDVPSFTLNESIKNITVSEDIEAQTVDNLAGSVSTGPANESGQTWDFVVTTNNDSLFAVKPAIDSNGTLTYTLKKDANGTATISVKLHDNGGTANNGVDISAAQTFTIDVTPVNDAPSFTQGNDIIVLEDAPAQTVSGWAKDVSAGAANENDLISFEVSTDNDSLFKVKPAIDSSNGNLTYELNNDVNGEATVTIKLKETADGGLESSVKTFKITVTPVNDAPTFDMSTNTQIVLEETGSHTVDNFVKNKTVGIPADEASQTLNAIEVSNNYNGLFDSQPAIDNATGTLTYTLKLDASGNATVTVKLMDNGGTANGGVDTTTKSFVISVRDINDIPSFTKGEDVEVQEDSGVQSIADWATGISVGNSFEEATQTPSFVVTVPDDKKTLFLSQPAISSNGTLTFTPEVDANGVVEVKGKITDNGGTDNGGVNESAEQTFIITIKAVNDAPVNTTIPVITGTPSIGTELTVSDGSWNDTKDSKPSTLEGSYIPNITYTYQWERANNSTGTDGLENISGQTTNKYTLADVTDNHKYIRVKVTATDSGYPEPALSTETYSAWTPVQNRLPIIAEGDSISMPVMDEDSDAKTITLNATDADSDTITWTIGTADGEKPNHGIATVTNPGTGTSMVISYKPEANYNGNDSFLVKVSDGYGGVDTIRIDVTINSVNDIPVIKVGEIGSEDVSITMDEDSSPQSFNLILSVDNADSINSDTITWSIDSGASHGTDTVTNPGTGTSMRINYTPEIDYHGSDSFIVNVIDTEGASDNITVNVTINPRNDAPVNTEIPTYTGTMEVGQELEATSTGTWQDDKDVNNTTTGYTPDITYTYQWQTADDASGTNPKDIVGATSLTFTLTANEAHKYVGVKVIATDDGEGTPVTQSTSANSIWNRVTNIAPIITEGTSKEVTMDEDGNPIPFTLTLNATDIDEDKLTWSISTEDDEKPSQGTATVTDTGIGNSMVINYNPTADYHGDDSFVVKLSDGNEGYDSIRINVTVNPVNDAPVNTAIPTYTGTMEVGQELGATSTGTWQDDKDVNNTTTGYTPDITYTYQWQTADDASGTNSKDIAGATSSTFILTANESHKFVGLKVIATDDGEGTPATQSSSANSVWNKVTNIAPIITEATSKEVTMDEDGNPKPFTLTLNATDVDEDKLTWSISTEDAEKPSHGTATVTGTGVGNSMVINYNPTADYHGDDSFVVKLSDGNEGYDSIRINVTVNPVNDAPVNTLVPTYKGTMKLGQELEATSTGTWQDDKDVNKTTTGYTPHFTYTYQWQTADDASGTNPKDIVGATLSTFILTANESHKYVGLKVIATDDGEGTPATRSEGACSSWKLVNNSPLAIKEGTDKALEVDEDGIPESFNLNVLDADNDTFIWNIGNPSNGTSKAVGVGNTKTIIYTPNPNYNGSDSFNVEVNDGYSSIASMTVTVTVKPTNDAPQNTIAPVISGTMEVDQVLSGTDGTWNDNIDLAPGSMTYSYQWQTATDTSGSGLENISGATNKTYKLTKNTVHEYIRLKVTATDDGEGLPNAQSTGAYSNWLQGTNKIPAISDTTTSTLSMDEDSNIVGINLDAADEDGDDLNWRISTPATNGTVTLTGYKPNANYNGADSFTAEVSDGHGGIATKSVSVTVNPINDAPQNTLAPVVSGIRQVGKMITGTTGTWNDDMDMVPGKITYTYQWQIANDSNGTGITDIAGATGTDYTLTDNETSKYIRLKVIATDDGEGIPNNQSTTAYSDWLNIPKAKRHNSPPVISEGSAITVTMDEDGKPIPFSLTLNVSDDDKDIITWSISDQGSHGVASVSGTGNSKSISYISDLDYYGKDNFTVQVSDGMGGIDTIVVTVNIIHVEKKSLITLTSNPTSIVGDGIQTALLTAYIFDTNNKPVSGVVVNFSATMGTFPSGTTGITDEDGKVLIVFKSPKIEGIESKGATVRAEVNDSSKNLYAYSEIIVTFEPSSIQGTVLDNDLKLPVEGAVVEVLKDFDEDGKVDFYAKMITGADGKYKIAVPKGNTSYDVSITKKVKIGNELKEITFNQTCETGDINGTSLDAFDANNSIVGLVLLKTPEESTKKLEDYGNYFVEIIDSEGNIVYTNPLNSKSLYQTEGLEKGKTYNLAVTYSLSNGMKLIVGKSEVTVKSDGEIIISTILIDPYGQITDADTGKPIEGVQVKLYYANTQRNIDSGKKPGSEVSLPIIKGFDPSDNANPQLSNYIGQYAFMVFPQTDYYIKAIKSGYETFTSETISVYDEIVKYDFKMKAEGNESNESNILPKTGTMIDYTILILIGSLISIIGILLLFYSRKHTKKPKV